MKIGKEKRESRAPDHAFNPGPGTYEVREEVQRPCSAK